ncbi:hypothetical protein COCCU_08120 [Corynebacterium occultum]|uniref:LemA family protein n=1 Tax=Corynebacterium occultum TaxID=2675219 RepID=A0A6B8W6K9_9CORY|nr:hypothetical protein [Corynebacterium occultum]QGU07557.1 hypothetical protein COCCU_08120 [Corynebacterium occultum]
MTIIYILLAVAITALLLWAYFTAQRLNRLHIRTDSALQNLQAALDLRASLAEALVPELTAVARSATALPLAHGQYDRRAAQERRLSEALSVQVAGQGVLPAPLIEANARVELAHRFYNDAVTTTRALRTRPLVRVCRLGGTAPLPDYFELAYLEVGEP